MENNIIRNQVIDYAVKLGYTVAHDGKIISPYNGVINGGKDDKGYRTVSIRYKNGKSYPIKVCRLAAYIKFGDIVFNEKIQVRHINGICTDDSFHNIEVGTAKDNAYDRNKVDRVTHAIKAATHIRKFDDKTIHAIRIKHSIGYTYKELMLEYGITSKGTMSYIINHSYVTVIE